MSSTPTTTPLSVSNIKFIKVLKPYPLPKTSNVPGLQPITPNAPNAIPSISTSATTAPAAILLTLPGKSPQLVSLTTAPSTTATTANSSKPLALTMASHPTAAVTRFMRQLTAHGVMLTAELLQAANTFVVDVQQVCGDRLQQLEAASKRLTVECEDLRRLCAEKQAVLDRYKQHFLEITPTITTTTTSSNPAVAVGVGEDTLKNLRALGMSFMEEIEALLRKAPAPRDDGVKEKEEMTLKDTIQALTDKLQHADEVSLEINGPLLYKLVMDLFEYDVVRKRLEADNPIVSEMTKVTTPENGLVADVLMGVQLDVPQVSTTYPNPPLPPLPPPRRSLHVQDIYRYLRACDESINVHGDRPIHQEVINNNLMEVRRYCIALRLAGVGVDVVNDEQHTALHLAVVHNASEEIISTLLQHGARFDALDACGNSVLHLAVEAGTMRKLLGASIPDDREMLRAVHRVIDAHNHEGVTALHAAAMKGCVESAKLLIDHQADINRLNKKCGRTALYHAVEGNHVDVVKLLIRNRADAHVKTYQGNTIIELLFEADSDFSSEMKKLFYRDRVHVPSRNVIERDELEAEENDDEEAAMQSDHSDRNYLRRAKRANGIGDAPSRGRKRQKKS